MRWAHAMLIGTSAVVFVKVGKVKIRKQMGASGSREIVVPLGTNPLSLPSTDAARKRAEDTYKAAEDSIFQEGYRQGVRDTTARYTEGAELAARAAYSRLLVSEEGRKGEEVEAAAAALRKTQYRAPHKPVDCVAEEKALTSCATNCGPFADAYIKCSKAVVDAKMNAVR